MRIALLFLLSFVSLAATAQTLAPVENGSKVHFVIDNFGIATGGDFKGITGSIRFDLNHPTAADFDVSVDAATIDTDIESRDSHLRKPDFFDVKNFPKITFKSTKITKTNKKDYLYLFGKITIKGVSKDIKFPFTVTPKDGGYLFVGSFSLNRRDFGVGGSSLSLSDNLTVSLSILAK
jgi:polyisoprenoid-binding protein YceI